MTIYANSPITFDHLTDREFEEVTEWYFKLEIENGKFIEHDKTELLPIGSDEGRDIMLLKDGRISGAVQCKKLQSNVTNGQIFNELIKFIMFHLLNESNDSPIKSHLEGLNSFVYYIVSAKDFSKNSFGLIHDFKNNWRIKQFKFDLNKVVENHKKKYKSFEDFDFNTNQKKIEEILDGLELKAIKSYEIDPIIRLSNEVINRYFQTDSRKLLTAKTRDKNLKNREKAIQISKDLNRTKEYFGNVKSSSIKRKEVNEIFSWINSPLEENRNNIAVLSANAGMGKTTAMLQLQNELLNENIPCYSLKADYRNYKSLTDFKNELAIEGTFIEFTLSIKGESDIVVVIIDQLDALSQTLSSDQSSLKTYNEIVSELETRDDVRIVISCREFDLENDPFLNHYKRKKVFRLEALTEEEIINVLDNQTFNRVKTNRSLLSLLTTPLHLDIFLIIYSEEVDVSKLKSLEGLYAEFWKQKISPTKKTNAGETDLKKVDNLIFQIADEMNLQQEIVISKSYFEDSFYNELNYLESSNIIKKSSTKIEFFHQSFFDYAFARNFVNSKKQLLDEVLSMHQGLLVRSKVKQIVDYTRNVNPSLYLKGLNEVLFNEKVRFHIKLMLTQQLVFRKNPTIGERSLLFKLFRSEVISIDILLRLHYSSNWLAYFFEEELIEYSLTYFGEDRIWSIILFLRQFEKKFVNEIVEFLWEIRDMDKAYRLCLDVLQRNNTLSNDLHFDMRDFLFDNYIEKIDPHYHLKLIKNSIVNDPNSAAKFLLNLNLDNIEIKLSERKEQFVGGDMFPELYNLFWEYHPRKAYYLIKEIFIRLMNELYASYYESKTVKVDNTFLSFLPSTSNDHPPFHFEQYDRFMKYLSEEDDIDFIREELELYLQSDNSSLLIVTLYVLSEKPKPLLDLSFRILNDCEFLFDIYRINNYSAYLIQVILNKSFGLFSSRQKKLVINVINNFYDGKMSPILINDDKKVKRNNGFYYDHFELIASIPIKELEKFRILRSEYLQLNRLYGTRGILEKPRNPKVLSSGEKPLPDSSYETMNLTNWKRTIYRFGTKHPKFDYWNDETRESSHSNRFETLISLNYKKFLPLIDEIIEDPKVTNTYKISAIKGLVKSECESKKAIDRFFHFYDTNELARTEKYELIWLTREFAIQNIDDTRITNFLIDISLSAQLNRDEKDRTKGYALEYLFNFAGIGKNSKRIFSTLEKVNDLNEVEKGYVIANINLLLKYDRKRVIQISLNLVDEFSEESVKYFVRVLQYLQKDEFKFVEQFYKNVISEGKYINGIGQLLVKAYCYGTDIAKTLIYAYCKQGENQTIDCLKMAFKFVESNTKTKRALEIMFCFIESKDDNVSKAYSTSFVHFDDIVFKKIKKFIEAYIAFQSHKNYDYALYDYLNKCCYKYPTECLSLIKEYLPQVKSNIYRTDLENKPIKLIINAYRALKETGEENLLDFAMDHLDYALTELEYFENAQEMLN